MEMTSDCDELVIPSDLTENGLEAAFKMLGSTFPTAPVTLMVREIQGVEAGYLCGLREGACRRRVTNIIFLPSGMVPDQDAWALTDGHKVIWSPGV